MSKKHEEYDWLNDPFDEKKCAEELERARKAKMRGCALAAGVAVVVLLVVCVLLAPLLSVAPFLSW